MLSMKPCSSSSSIYLHRAILASFFFCIFFFGNQPDTSAQIVSKRPSVGLVLSGGGAHGIAHLGVIKVMEEAGLRPDYITGVSMGSIVGGFYSMGYSADSLYKIFKKINWESILSNKIEENKVIFLEKSHFDNSILSLPLSNKKVQFPSGLINGQQVENTLNFYAWPAADINDFSKLPIPFLCVAADIIRYKKVDLKTGYLPDAIRASFSVPSIFTPFKIDSLLLLDGGLIRNFAASEIKDMGADIVIGSYVGFEAYKEDELQSLSGIVKQIAMFRSLEDFESEKKFVNVLIKPNISGLSITGFNNVDSLFQRGYKAALPYKENFRKLADSLNRISPQKPLENILDKQSYVFDQIEIHGNKTYSYYQILGVLDITPGVKVDKYLLTDRIELLYGKAWFDKVRYRIINRNGSLTLAIDCVEKPAAMLYGSVHYDNSLHSGIIVGLSVKNLLTQRSVININSYIGEFYRLKINSLQFIDKNQKFGLSANFYADNTLVPMLELRGDFGDVFSRNFISGISINNRLGLNNMMTFSTDYENLNLILHYFSNAHLKNLSYNYMTSALEYQLNSLDSKHFPNKGVVLNAYAGTSRLISGGIRTDSSKVVFSGSDESNFSFDRFYTLYGNYRQYFSSGRRLTFSLGADILYITDSDSVSAQNNFYLLGGIESLSRKSIPMSGFHSNQIPVKKLAGIRTDLDIQLYENIHLNFMADIFAAQEVNKEKGFSVITGYGIGLGYMSIIGPMRIGIMHGSSGRNEYLNKTKGFISIGYNF
jgi:NTE family protein